MKFNRIILSIAFIFIATLLSAQASFKGYIVDEDNNKMKEVNIILYKDNQKVSIIKWDKKFDYNLAMEGNYTIEFFKEGYLPKKIAISTMGGTNDVEPFIFTMELKKDNKKVDKGMFDFPAAIVKYKKSKGRFDFDIAYSKRIKKEQDEAMKTAAND